MITGHEDPSKPASTLDWAKLADPQRTLVILMAHRESCARSSRELVAHGLARDDAGRGRARRHASEPTNGGGTLATIAQTVAAAKVGAPAVIVVGEVASLREQLRWFDRGPLFGKRVPITRTGEQSDAFARALLETRRRADRRADDRDRAARRSGAGRAGDRCARIVRVAVFTSQNGVDAFFARLAARGADARAIGSAKVAAIGERSAERLRAYGIACDVVPQTFIAEAVAEAVIARARPGERVLLYRAQEARDVLPRDARRRRVCT